MTEDQQDTEAQAADDFGPAREVAVRARGDERDTVDGWVSHARAIFYLAGQLAQTEFVPRPLRGKEAACAATVLMGRELGIGPMFSFRAVQVVEGTPTLSSEFKRARVLAAGHEIEVLELTSTRCKVRGRRRGATAAWLEMAYTIDDARRANLIRGKGAWETRPRRMLLARATSDLCDAIFPDVILGLPTTELAGEDFAGYADGGQPALPAPEPARTARRRSAPRRQASSGGPAPGVQPPDSPPEPDMPELEPEPAPDPPPDTAGPDPGHAAGDPDAKASKAERDMLFSRLGDEAFGITDRALRLRVAGAVTGRQVRSYNDLTSGDVAAIADVLASCVQAATEDRSAYYRLGQFVRLAEQQAGQPGGALREGDEPADEPPVDEPPI